MQAGLVERTHPVSEPNLAGFARQWPLAKSYGLQAILAHSTQFQTVRSQSRAWKEVRP